jgi:hypothetical protein
MYLSINSPKKEIYLPITVATCIQRKKKLLLYCSSILNVVKSREACKSRAACTACSAGFVAGTGIQFRPEHSGTTEMAGILAGTELRHLHSVLISGTRYTGHSGQYRNGIHKYY